MTRYIEFSLYGKTDGLLENSYRKRALDLPLFLPKKVLKLKKGWKESEIFWY